MGGRAGESLESGTGESNLRRDGGDGRAEALGFRRCRDGIYLRTGDYSARRWGIGGDFGRIRTMRADPGERKFGVSLRAAEGFGGGCAGGFERKNLERGVGVRGGEAKKRVRQIGRAHV